MRVNGPNDLHDSVRNPAAFTRDEHGATAVLAALTAPMLLALAGLAAEGGMAYFKHASMQSVSDAAAYSAAAALRAGAGLAGAKLEATAVAASMGYRAIDDGPIDVTVNVPPLSGPNLGNVNATEVILKFQQSPLLTKVFRSDPYTIRTRSVSIAGAPSDDACVLALDGAGSAAVDLKGSPDIVFNKCNLAINSSSPTALSLKGSGSIKAPEIDVVGGIETKGNVSLAADVQKIGAPSIADPYATLPLPSTTPCGWGNLNYSSATSPGGTQTLTPGVYCGGLSISGKKTNVTLTPGLYVMVGGDFSVTSNATLTGAGVTIVTIPAGGKSSTVYFHSGANVTLSAQTTGPYKGVAVYATGGTAAAPDSVTWNGGPSVSINGALYMPHTSLTTSGGLSSAGGCIQIVAWQVHFGGNAALATANCANFGTTLIGADAGRRVVLTD